MAELKDWQKLALYASGLGGALLLGYVVVRGVVAPGPPGGSCSDPSSPCGSAIQPYASAANNCAMQHAQYLNQFLAEDSANGTGFTQAQLQILNQLQQCIDQNATQMAAIAKQYEPQQVPAVLAYWLGVAAVTAAAAYGAGAIIRSLKTVPRSGADVGNLIKNALTQLAAKTGLISPSSAAAFSSQLPSVASADSAEDSAFYTALADANIIAAEEAIAIADEDAATILSDVDETISILEGI